MKSTQFKSRVKGPVIPALFVGSLVVTVIGAYAMVCCVAQCIGHGSGWLILTEPPGASHRQCIADAIGLALGVVVFVWLTAVLARFLIDAGSRYLVIDESLCQFRWLWTRRVMRSPDITSLSTGGREWLRRQGTYHDRSTGIGTPVKVASKSGTVITIWPWMIRDWEELRTLILGELDEPMRSQAEQAFDAARPPS